MSVRRSLAIFWTIGAFALMLASWMFYAGPYRWAAEWQLEHFHSYELKLTLFGPLIVLLIPAGFLGGWGPLAPRRVCNPAVRVSNAKRNAGMIALLGMVALAIGAASGAVGYYRMRTPPTRADLVLITGTEPAPGADLVKITGIARTDMIVEYQETVAGSTSRWSFLPLVAPAWHSGEPVRFLLKTNQTAWIPPGGTEGPFMPRMLRPGNPPFRMITEPSVLKSHDLPGVVRAEYEKSRISLDPKFVVAEQSAGELLAPYWMVAAGGGLVGVCLLLGGLLGAVNARRAVLA